MEDGTVNARRYAQTNNTEASEFPENIYAGISLKNHAQMPNKGRLAKLTGLFSRINHACFMKRLLFLMGAVLVLLLASLSIEARCKNN